MVLTSLALSPQYSSSGTHSQHTGPDSNKLPLERAQSAKQETTHEHAGGASPDDAAFKSHQSGTTEAAPPGTNTNGARLRSNTRFKPRDATSEVTLLQTKVAEIAFSLHSALVEADTQAETVSADNLNGLLQTLYATVLDTSSQTKAWSLAVMAMKKDGLKTSLNMLEALISAWLYTEILARSCPVHTPETLIESFRGDQELVVDGLASALSCEPEDYFRHELFWKLQHDDFDSKLRAKAQELVNRLIIALEPHLDAMTSHSGTYGTRQSRARMAQARTEFYNGALDTAFHALRLKAKMDLAVDDFRISWLPRGLKPDSARMSDWVEGDLPKSQVDAPLSAFSMFPFFETAKRGEEGTWEVLKKVKTMFEDTEEGEEEEL